MYDVCIVGAGPAGLSAALILGRCRRRVIVLDSGRPRNAVSGGLHGFLTRDGTHPMKLRELGRAELAHYPSVEVREVEVRAAQRGDRQFAIELREGPPIRARILLLATGRSDVVPDKKGFHELYGRGIFHCPYCDGWEHRDRPWVAYGRDSSAVEFALELLMWTSQITVCTDGPATFSAAACARLRRHRIALEETPVVAAEAGADGWLERLQLSDNRTLPCAALFFDTDCPQKSPLAENLGCTLDDTGAVRCRGPQSVEVPGVFLAGNIRGGLHLAITAAAEGVEAATAINDALLEHDLA